MPHKCRERAQEQFRPTRRPMPHTMSGLASPRGRGASRGGKWARAGKEEGGTTTSRKWARCRCGGRSRGKGKGGKGGGPSAGSLLHPKHRILKPVTKDKEGGWMALGKEKKEIIAKSEELMGRRGNHLGSGDGEGNT